MESTKRKIAKIILLRRLRERFKRKQREYYVRPIFLKRLALGESVLVKELRSDPCYHHKYFRMSSTNFDNLLNAIRGNIQGNSNHAIPISPLEKLAITLRYLASGSSQVSLGMSYRISPSSICKILRQTMEAICSHLTPIYLPTPSKEIWKHSEQQFNVKWNYPHCCGAIDGKHVRVKAPYCSGSQYYNYKGYFSVVLMGIVDANYKFIAVDIGSSGSISDGVLMRSKIGLALQSGILDLPEDKEIDGTDTSLPYVIVGDDAFPLKHNLMKPYPGKFLSVPQRIFNYRLSRARMVVENAFGILASRWRILHTPIHVDSNFVNLIIQTCVLLHNFLMSNLTSFEENP